MGATKEYDLLNYRSRPSSLKLQSDLPDWWFSGTIAQIGVTPGSELTSRIFAKQENVTTVRPSGIYIHGWDGTGWPYIAADILVPHGDHPDWILAEKTITIPPEITAIRIEPWIGATLGPEAPGTVWYDDLEIYEDGVLIYYNDFTEPLGWGVGATVSVNGVCDAGYPTPDMILELYDNGVLRKTVTIPGADLVLGTKYTLTETMTVADVGDHIAYGRMVLSNPLGDWEFTTPEREFSIGEMPPGEVTVDIILTPG